MRNKSTVMMLIVFLLSSVSVNAADRVIIGKGSGILWEGLPFTATLTGPMNHAATSPMYGLMNISNMNYQCMASTNLTTIAGMKALKIAPGVGLIPRATATATYTAYDGSRQNISGTIGLPQTAGGSNGELISPAGYDWCIPASMTGNNNFFNASASRTVDISGSWVLVADGTQTSTTVSLPVMYASSFSVLKTGDRYQSILPAGLSLRISTLECSVNTPTVINFGTVGRNLITNSELSKKSNSLIVACSQASNLITANIGIQFRALTGLYNGVNSRLSLEQGGGYITGEIPNITNSGACNSSTGITYDNAPLNLGAITNGETSKTLTNQIIWRLCSGGNMLPSGPVSASTEMLVTFN